MFASRSAAVIKATVQVANHHAHTSFCRTASTVAKFSSCSSYFASVSSGRAVCFSSSSSSLSLSRRHEVLTCASFSSTSSSSSFQKPAASASLSSSLIRAYKSPTLLPVEHLLSGESLLSAKREVLPYFNLTISPRQLCDIEMILNGAFTPLDGFMNQAQYQSVVETMRLPDGTLFPLPITLDVTNKQASEIRSHSQNKSIALRDVEGNCIAILDIEDMYTPDKSKEAQQCFGGDPEHPAVDYLNRVAGTVYIGGKLRGLQLPCHYDHSDLRLTPLQTRARLSQLISSSSSSGPSRAVVAFQTRNPLHRAHYELTRAAQQALRSPSTNEEALLLLHPVVGMTKPGDIDYQTRVKCYRALTNRYASNSLLLSVIPLAMRMAGPREALLHAIIRQNYGASHFIIGRDHAGPGSNSKGVSFYSAYEARDVALSMQKELDIQLMPFEQMVFVANSASSPSSSSSKAGEDDGIYVPANKVSAGMKSFNLSGTEVRRRLSTGEDIPSWFSFPEVVNILRKRHPPRHRQGFCLFFTGLSGSGKSTVAMALREKMMSSSEDERSIVLLDGDEMRSLISSELGFSREHRDLNIRRIGFIASLITQTRGIAIACPIAPYNNARQDARRMVMGGDGAFIEIYMQADVNVCSTRDRKGLYAKAKMGLLKNLTGVDDPYEAPINPEITIEHTTTVANAVQQICQYLYSKGFLKSA